MPSPERRKELEERYLRELLKVGFSEDKAKEIVAEAADRLGTDEDPPKPEMGPIYSFHKKITRAPVFTATSEQAQQIRAVSVIERKEAQHRARQGRTTWTQLKRHRTAAKGRNAMEVMQEMLAEDMKALEFTPGEIEFILGKD